MARMTEGMRRMELAQELARKSGVVDFKKAAIVLRTPLFEVAYDGKVGMLMAPVSRTWRKVA